MPVQDVGCTENYRKKIYRKVIRLSKKEASSRYILNAWNKTIAVWKIINILIRKWMLNDMNIEIRWVPTTTINLKIILELSPVILKIDGNKWWVIQNIPEDTELKTCLELNFLRPVLEDEVENVVNNRKVETFGSYWWFSSFHS